MTDRPTWEETLEAIESDNPETPRFVLPASRVVVVEVDCPDCDSINYVPHLPKCDDALCEHPEHCPSCAGRGKVLVAADGWQLRRTTVMHPEGDITEWILVREGE